MNTIDLKGDDQTFREIVSRTIDSFVDDTLTIIGDYAFGGCTALKSVNIPAVTSVGVAAFANCLSLTSVDLQSVTLLKSSSFSRCSSLTKLIIRNTDGVVTISDSSVFSGTSNAIIYVPDALVDSYKNTTVWSNYASRIKGLSELPA